MPTGTSKLRLLIELDNKMKGGLDKARKRIDRATGGMQKKLNDFKVKNIEAFDQLKQEVPGLERALNVLKNPYVAGTAAAVAFTAAIGKATSEAMNFEHEFMNIRQLNLDKPREELNKYRSDIMDTAMDTGINVKKMSQGYYDLQSALGVYGDEAKEIANQVGRYSISTQADFNESINQTSKAMKAFEIPADEVQSLLESNAKAVQTGVVTYGELAKVQTEYAGKAAAIGQNVDTANKIFAAFTSIAKNADTAATMTKSAFEGLADPKVLKGMEDYGVKIYDANDNMRSLDKIIKDTSEKIDAMNDQKFNKFMGDVGGPEGLRMLFGKLRTGADDFFKTMKTYETSAVDLNKMYENATQDPLTVWRQVKNNFNTMFTKIGLKFLGLVDKIGIGILKVIDWFRSAKDEMEIVGHIIAGLGVAWTVLNAKIIAGKVATMGLVVATKLATAAQWLFNAAANANPIGVIVMALGALIGYLVYAYKKFDKFRAIIKGTWEVIKGFGKVIKEYVINRVKGILSGLGSLANSIKLLFKGKFGAAWDEAKKGASGLIGIDARKKAIEQTVALKYDYKSKYAFEMAKAKKEKAEEKEDEKPTLMDEIEYDGAGDSTDKGGNNKGNQTRTSPQSIGGGGQAKTTKISIDSFIKNFNPTHQSINNMNKDELERWMTEMFLRVTQSAERTGA